jgi:hypothetical protein
MLKRLLTGLVASIALAGWTGHAEAQLFSSTGPVIAIVDGELLIGEATGHLGGWGTIALRSRLKAGLTCAGEFSYSEALGDAGQVKCSDGTRTAFRFRRLSPMSGYGTGGSGLSFTYGLSAEASVPYLDIPAGKELRRAGNVLEIVATLPIQPR